MKSPTHRAVLLTRVFRHIGVGAVKTDDGYASVDGTVWFFTLDLGRRVLQKKPEAERVERRARKRPFCVLGSPTAGPPAGRPSAGPSPE